MQRLVASRSGGSTNVWAPFTVRAHRSRTQHVSDRTPITIVIADDHAVVRQGLRLLLEAEEDLAVVGESSDIPQTCALLRAHAPRVVLLDLHMGRELSLSALFELRSASSSTAVVILTME